MGVESNVNFSGQPLTGPRSPRPRGSLLRNAFRVIIETKSSGVPYSEGAGKPAVEEEIAA